MAGESARRQYERLRDERRRQRRAGGRILLVLTVVSVIGGAVGFELLLGVWWIGALAGLLPIMKLLLPGQREVAWRKGAEGEESVGRALDQLGPSCRALHDRRIPGSRANIDHILIAPTGVWTIDAKNYSGKLETRRHGAELWVNGRNRSKLLDQARRQTKVVHDVLTAEGLARVPVRPALCFLGVEWPLLFMPKAADDVALLSPRRVGQLTEGPKVIPPSGIEQVATALEQSLQPAAPGASGRSSPPPGRPVADPATRPPPRATMRAGSGPGDLKVNPWKRYGKNRLYVNDRDGTTLGYVDLETNEVVPTEEHHRHMVREAAAAYLRES